MRMTPTALELHAIANVIRPPRGPGEFLKTLIRRKPPGLYALPRANRVEDAPGFTITLEAEWFVDDAGKSSLIWTYRGRTALTPV